MPAAAPAVPCMVIRSRDSDATNRLIDISIERADGEKCERCWNYSVEVGKDGYVYLLNRDNLGGFAEGSSGSDEVVQRIGPYGGVWSRPGIWPAHTDSSYPVPSSTTSVGSTRGMHR